MRSDLKFTDDEKQALERIRQQNNWTYRELAALTAVTLPTLQRVLTTDARPNARNAFKLRRFLELHAPRRRSA